MSDTVRKKIRVLVVDDSALVRKALESGLSAFADIEVVAAARDPYEARDFLVKLRPDVMTLDVEMPRMDGITYLRKVMAVLPTPTIVLSSLTDRTSALAGRALDAGAVAVVAKPKVGIQQGLQELMETLAAQVRKAALTRVRATSAEPVQPTRALEETTDKVIGIGASTGGVAALGRILPLFASSSPGIVVVQHMAAGFTRDFALRLDGLCQMRVMEAVDGQRVLRGHVLVAPGGVEHCEVRRVGGEYRIRLHAGPPVSGHLPSVDVLFESLAAEVGRNAAGCLLTGMGADGAEGLLRMRAVGAHTLTQDRATCAVWGMPAAAVERGAAERVLPLEEIPAALTSWAGRTGRGSLAS